MRSYFAALIMAVTNAQVAKECFHESLDAYGTLTGTQFSTQDDLLYIDFNRTMVLSTITACLGTAGQVYSI